jgi:hypothetical protein
MGIWNKFVTFLIGEPNGERARDNKGRYVADDKSTPDVNEAYTDGKTPTKKATKTKTTTTKKRGRGRPKGSKNKSKK